MKNEIILRLYNGCDTIEDFQTKEDWGPHEIVLGPITGMLFTYGTVRLFNENEIGELEFHDEGTLVHYAGKYYGDYEIVNENTFEVEPTKINPVHLKSFEIYKKEFSKIAWEEYAWADTEYTDEELMNLGYESGETPQELMDYFASKYDLDPMINRIGL